MFLLSWTVGVKRNVDITRKLLREALLTIWRDLKGCAALNYIADYLFFVVIWMMEPDCEGVQKIPCTDSYPVVFAKEFCGAPKVSYPGPYPWELTGTLNTLWNPSFAGDLLRVFMFSMRLDLVFYEHVTGYGSMFKNFLKNVMWTWFGARFLTSISRRQTWRNWMAWTKDGIAGGIPL